MSIIRVEGLTKRFGDLVAVDGLALSVDAGTIFGLVGPDGAGKTTTLRLLTGLLRPDAGAITVAGHDVAADPESVHGTVGYMSQRFGLYPDLTVLENVRFYADLYDVPRSLRQARIDELLGFSNLLPFKARRAGKLSGGMKQKLGLACALIHTPPVLVLDEPTNGVDPVSRRDFWRLLNRLVVDHGTTIVVATAYLDEAERFTRLALLDRGRLVACDSPEGIKTLIRGVLVELWPDRPRQALGVLRTQFPQAAVTLFGDRLHVVLPDEAQGRAAVERALAGAGLTLREWRVVPPSLEDVFVAVLAGGDHG